MRKNSTLYRTTMILPMRSSTVVTYNDQMRVVLTIVIMGMIWAPVALCRVALGNLSILAVALPIGLRLLTVATIVPLIGWPLGCANPILVGIIISWVVFLSFIWEYYGWSMAAPNVVLHRAVGIFFKAFIIVAGYLIPHWCKNLKSGFEILYAAIVCGVCLGAVESLQITMSHLIGTEDIIYIDPFVKLFMWFNFIWLILIYSGLAVISGSVITWMATDIVNSRW